MSFFVKIPQPKDVTIEPDEWRLACYIAYWGKAYEDLHQKGYGLIEDIQVGTEEIEDIVFIDELESYGL